MYIFVDLFTNSLHFFELFLQKANLLWPQKWLLVSWDPTSNTWLPCSHHFQNETLLKRPESGLIKFRTLFWIRRSYQTSLKDGTLLTAWAAVNNLEANAMIHLRRLRLEWVTDTQVLRKCFLRSLLVSLAFRKSDTACGSWCCLQSDLTRLAPPV